MSTMVTQALFAMGAIADPRTGQRFQNLDLARHHIDMLGVLQEKTKGNLDDEEAKMIDQTVQELRMYFTQISEQLAKQQAQQAAQGGASGAPGEGNPFGGQGPGPQGPLG